MAEIRFGADARKRDDISPDDVLLLPQGPDLERNERHGRSFPRGKRRRVKDDSISLDDDARAELRKLRDRPIDRSDPDAPEIEEFMLRERGKFYRPVKQQITLRLDKDIIAWFKASGDKYQTRINEALRDYIRLQARRDEQ